MADIETLRRQFGGDDINFVYAPDGLIKIVVKNKAAAAEVFLLGATVTHYQPAGHEPVIFVSAESFFKPDKAIRGGIPICWPWFGPHPTDSRQSQHGLVRNKPWKLVGVQTIDPQHTRLKLEIGVPGAVATATITVGPSLEVELRSQNDSAETMRVEEALHTYLVVGDSEQVLIDGLSGTTYIDKVAGGQRKPQGSEPITFTGETDRVYLNTESACLLTDPLMQRRITVGKRGSKSTVVWNPWMEKSKGLSDFGDDEWQKMCCIETANAAENHLMLPAGQTHSIATEISVEKC